MRWRSRTSLGDRLMEGVFAAFPFFFVPFLILVIGLLGYGLYDAFVAETFSLRKDEFGCTASHYETSYVTSGKSTYPTTVTVCDQWSRR